MRVDWYPIDGTYEFLYEARLPKRLPVINASLYKKPRGMGIRGLYPDTPHMAVGGFEFADAKKKAPELIAAFADAMRKG